MMMTDIFVPYRKWGNHPEVFLNRLLGNALKAKEENIFEIFSGI